MAAVLFSAVLAIQDMKLFTQLETGLGFTCASIITQSMSFNVFQTAIIKRNFQRMLAKLGSSKDHKSERVSNEHAVIGGQGGIFNGI